MRTRLLSPVLALALTTLAATDAAAQTGRTLAQRLDSLAGDRVLVDRATAEDNGWKVGDVLAATEFNAGDKQNFSRYYPKRLPAEVLLDSIDRVTDARTNFNGLPPDFRAVQLPEEMRRTDIPYTARIQDVYSLRCAPQVYGPVFDARHVYP